MSSDRDSLVKRYYELRWGSWEYQRSDPDRAIAMLEEALEIAQSLDESFWIMDSRHWLAQVVIFHKRDYVRGLSLAVESAVEARKPIYSNWQMRTCLFQDLIAAHVGSDPVSHMDTIEAALDKMQAEVDQGSQCAHCLRGERAGFERLRNDLEAARQAALACVSEARDNHHRSFAHFHMAAVAFLEEEWPALLEHAQAAQKLGEKADNLEIIICSLVWQAIARLHAGDGGGAQICFRQSESQRQICGVTLDPEYWNARVAYHELIGDLDTALAARQEHLEGIAGHGALREEALAWLDLCRLQKLQGQLTEQTVQQTREAIAALKIPGDLPDQFQRLLDDRPDSLANIP